MDLEDGLPLATLGLGKAEAKASMARTRLVRKERIGLPLATAGKEMHRGGLHPRALFVTSAAVEVTLLEIVLHSLLLLHRLRSRLRQR